MLGDDLKVNLRFESFVNLEWCKTCQLAQGSYLLFESFVNLEWCKTKVYIGGSDIGLRALLI